jgi:hypothetical protein
MPDLIYDDGRRISAVDQEIQKAFGMQPGLDRASILPFAGRRSQHNLQWAAPDFVYQLAKAFVTPKVALDGNQISPEDAMNVAMNVTGGSLGASKVTGPTGEVLGAGIAKRDVPTITGRISKFTDQSDFYRHEADAIQHYIGNYGGQKPATLGFDGFEHIQDYLNTGAIGKYDKKSLDSVVSSLANKINSTSMTGDATVYRGSGGKWLKSVFGVDTPRDISPGMVVSPKAFTSTTFDKTMASSFAHDDTGPMSVIYKINTKKGDKALDLTNFSPHGERELLFAPNTNFKVTDVATGRGKKPVVTLEVVK